MGQKIHPVGLRLGITRTWDSRWFEKKNYRAWLHEDAAIRKYFGRMTRAAAISRVEIERRANQTRVIVHTAKPGIIIGKRGVGIEEIRKNLERLTKKQVQVNVGEIKHPELDSRLVGQNIVDQLEKRIAFRRAMKQAIMRTMKAGARGIKVQVSGRLGRRGNRAHRAQLRRKSSAAHAARRHRLRARRSVHDLRTHRRQGLDLQGRGASGAAARRSASEC